jgi:hypothetical protein
MPYWLCRTLNREVSCTHWQENPLHACVCINAKGSGAMAIQVGDKVRYVSGMYSDRLTGDAGIVEAIRPSVHSRILSVLWIKYGYFEAYECEVARTSGDKCVRPQPPPDANQTQLDLK